MSTTLLGVSVFYLNSLCYINMVTIEQDWEKSEGKLRFSDWFFSRPIITISEKDKLAQYNNLALPKSSRKINRNICC